MLDLAEAVDAIEAAAPGAKAETLVALLRRLDPLALKYVVRMLASDLRIGLRDGLVEEAIALAFGVPAAGVRRVHMLTGDLAAAAVVARRGEVAGATLALFKPIRFMLASAVATPQEAIARVATTPAWTEEKYDGVRCQLHRRGQLVALYSRDLRETTASFPEIAEAAATLGPDLLLDGEVLGHRDGRVLRFGELQRRLGRRVVGARLRAEVPLVFVAFDLLYVDGESLLDHPLRERRARLEALGLEPPFLLARQESATDAADLERIFAETRERGNEGLMLKSPESAYTPGRRGLAWLKLKRPLATLDVVVTAVEWGHGRRKGVLSDYTFAVLDQAAGTLVDIGKAYRGLTDAEIATMTEHFLAATTADNGWRRTVRPDTVIEVAFDSIQRSQRHASGFALRFPRIVRLRPDKAPSEIDTLATVAELHHRFFGAEGPALEAVAET
ncbi:MAG TPA: ATP-dependent DNA ligase [Candidatus Dormibacteraeota bacterium]|nr:ATP-dependent DNA ligase [Candidatus Dormibacteraeota bacterium]